MFIYLFCCLNSNIPGKRPSSQVGHYKTISIIDSVSVTVSFRFRFFLFHSRTLFLFCPTCLITLQYRRTYIHFFFSFLPSHCNNIVRTRWTVMSENIRNLFSPRSFVPNLTELVPRLFSKAIPIFIPVVLYDDSELTGSTF